MAWRQSNSDGMIVIFVTGDSGVPAENANADSVACEYGLCQRLYQYSAELALRQRLSR